MNRHFSTPNPPRLRIEFRSGSIDVRTEQVGETTVELRGGRDNDATAQLIADTTVEQRGDDIVVIVPKRSGGIFSRAHDLHLTITAPQLATLAIESGSADITARGDFGATTVQSGSGDVTIGHIADSVKIRSGSGNVRIDKIGADALITTGSADVYIGEVSGAVSLTTGSGDVRLGAGGSALDVKTGSGDVSIGEAPVQLSAKTASGDVSIDSVRHGEVKARTASGDLRAGVRAGTAAWLDVRTISGRVSSDLEAAAEPADDDSRVRIQLETVSGDIELVRVASR
jgi:DUF4097 and DUF4098 domain-containing protein YvlB